jgi:hypothetical protein
MGSSVRTGKTYGMQQRLGSSHSQLGVDRQQLADEVLGYSVEQSTTVDGRTEGVRTKRRDGAPRRREVEFGRSRLESERSRLSLLVGESTTECRKDNNTTGELHQTTEGDRRGFERTQDSTYPQGWSSLPPSTLCDSTTSAQVQNEPKRTHSGAVYPGLPQWVWRTSVGWESCAASPKSEMTQSSCPNPLCPMCARQHRLKDPALQRETHLVGSCTGRSPA